MKFDNSRGLQHDSSQIYRNDEKRGNILTNIWWSKDNRRNTLNVICKIKNYLKKVHNHKIKKDF